LRRAGSFGVAIALVAAAACHPGPAQAPRPGLERADVGKPDRAFHEAFGESYMIASQGEATSLAAREILAQGGNVFDAAVAASFTLAVERPQSTGLGGGGFMLVRRADTGEVLAFDFREEAPAQATESMFLNERGEVVPGLSTTGILAAAVPGMVAGVLAVHEKLGRLPRQAVLAPAIRLAEQGFRVYPHLATAIKDGVAALDRYPASKAIFLHADGTPLAVGDVLRQTDLGKTLRTIAAHGRDGFYKGWVADALLAEERDQHGLITQADLDGYAVKIRTPVMGDFLGYKVYSMPPPSSGGVHIIEIVNILEEEGFDSGPYTALSLHRTAAAMQASYADRSRYLGDPDFVKVPVAGLTADEYAKEQARRIPPRQARHADELRAPGPDPLRYEFEGPTAPNNHPAPAPAPARSESKDTTHFTIADKDGNVVSSTQTVNGWLGSKVVVAGAGFLLNDQMDDFSAKPGQPNAFGVTGGKANAIAPKKRPLSSMSPTIIVRDGKLVLALGSPSGAQIITCVALTVLNYLAYKAPLYDSVAGLRYHHQWLPDTLVVENPGFPADVERELGQMGYNVQKAPIGCKIEAVAFEQGRLHGVADPRGEGLAIGEGPLPTRSEEVIDVPVRHD
jgi:gamma-glutamyltranspeptidase/glutathione hydrolase